MASDKRLDQVKLVNSAESVLVVNGDQVEKATLAGFANSMGSSVPLQQTSSQVNITGLYARTSDGKMVELTKESVASVVAGRFMFGALTNSADVDSLTGFGFYSVGGIQNTSLPSEYGILMCFQTNGWYDRIQIFIPTDSSTNVSFRVATQKGGFGPWKKIAFTN